MNFCACFKNCEYLTGKLKILLNYGLNKISPGMNL